MSRKTSQIARDPAYGATKLSAFDVGHKRTSGGKLEGHHQQRSTSKNPIQTQVTDLNGSGSSTESTASDEPADGEGDEKGAKADEDEDEDEDDDQEPDVQAPSGRATNSFKRQAGHLNVYLVSPNRERSASNIDYAEKEAHAEDSSNDEAYGGVDLISDSEKDGSDMEGVEERAIIDSEDEDVANVSSTVKHGNNPGRARSPSESSEDNWDGFDFGDGDLPDHQDFFDEQFNRTDFEGFSTEENDIFGNLDMFGDSSLLSPASPPRRRVRFAEPLLEDPRVDIGFPSALQALANDALLASAPGIPQDGTKTHTSQPEIEEASDTESGSSSGYESDYGETTDEDDVPASATARPQSLIRRTSGSSLGNASATPTPTSTPLAQRRGPRMGTWCIDPTKPIAIVDSCGKKILVCPARRPKKPDRVFEHILGSASTSVNTSPRTQVSNLVTVPNSDIDPSEYSSQEIVSPMFGGMPTPKLGLSASDLFADDTDDTAYLEDNALLYDEMDDNDDDDHEDGINIEDLIDFGDYGEDSELDLTLEESRPSTSSSMKMVPASLAQSTSKTLLSHLDSIDVTAFRQTQLPAPASLSPLSPLKKRKLSPPIGGPSKRRLVA